MSLRKIGTAAGLAILTLLVWVAPSMAEDHYGALAYSTSSGRYGYSYDYGSRESAEERAISECNDNTCSAVLWFKNACAALATGDGHAYGTGWASERAEAENTAMSYCNKYGSNCSITRWVCTTR